jgi:hypothetical protein
MSGDKLDRMWLTEELFLNASVPIIRNQIKKSLGKVCFGCNRGSLSQTSHDCLESYENCLIILLPQAVISMDQKRFKIIKRMWEIYEADVKNEQFHYGHLSALDILDFMGGGGVDPFKQITIDFVLQNRLRDKILEESENMHQVVMTKELKVQKRPVIEESILSMFA